MKDEFSLKKILKQKSVEELNILFNEWNINKPWDVKDKNKDKDKDKKELINIFIKKAQEKDRQDYIFNKLTPNQQLLVSLAAAMGGRVKIDLMDQYDLRKRNIYPSTNYRNSPINLDDTYLLFLDHKTDEYVIPTEFYNTILKRVKERGKLNIIVQKDIVPTERYNMMNGLLRFLCFVDINDIKVKQNGEIYKKNKERLAAELKSDVILNCDERLKPLVLSNYINFLRYIAEKLALVFRGYNRELNASAISMTGKALHFLKKDMPEKQRVIFSNMEVYERNFLYDILKYSQDARGGIKGPENSWIKMDAFLKKIKADEILNFKENSGNENNPYMFHANCPSHVDPYCIMKFTRFGILELYTDYRHTCTDLYEPLIDCFRLTEYGIKFINNVKETEETEKKDRKDMNKYTEDTDKVNKVLVTHPNFEITVLPNTAPDVFFILNRLADPVKFDVASTYKFTRESVLRAMNKGMNKETIISFIREHSKNEIPDNVMYSLNDWLLSRKVVQLNKAVFLETEKDLMDPVLKHIGALKKVNDNLTIINEKDISSARQLIKIYKKSFIKFDDPVLLHFAVSKMKAKQIRFKIAEPGIIIIEDMDISKAVDMLKNNGIIVENK